MEVLIVNKWLVITFEGNHTERWQTFADTKEEAIEQIKRIGNFDKISAYDYYLAMEIDTQIFARNRL